MKKSIRLSIFTLVLILGSQTLAAHSSVPSSSMKAPHISGTVWQEGPLSCYPGMVCLN